MFIKLLLVLAVPALVRSDLTPVLNKIVDDLILLAEKELKDEISLDHITFPYTFKWLFFSRSGNVDCHNGKVKSLKTLKRTEDTSVTVDKDNKIRLKAGVGLTELDFVFDDCIVDWFMVPKGPLQGHIGSNAIDILFDLELGTPSTDGNFECIATIKDVNLVNYGDVKFQLKGKGVLHWIEEKILNLVGTGSTAKNMLNNVIKAELQEHIPKFDIIIKPIIQLQSAVQKSVVQKTAVQETAVQNNNPKN